jgi:hypothetical protein
MAKIKLPYWLDEVYGKIQKNNMVFRRKGRTIVLESDPTPSYTRTDAQAFIRNKYYDALKSWYSLSESERKLYNEKGSRLGLSGWNVYVMETMKGVAYQPFNYEITINNSQNNNTLTDYQVLLNISNDSVFFSTIGDKKFMEFYDTDKATLLNHYVELWDTQNYNAKIWIKIPNIPANSIKKVYLKRNFTRITDLSNPYNTFDFYDDFNVDLSKWTQNIGTWSLATDDSLSVLKSPSDDNSQISTSTFSIKDCRIISKFRLAVSNSKNHFDTMARWQNTSNYYYFQYESNVNQLQIYKVVNGSHSLLAQVSQSTDLNYHVMECRLFGTSLKLYFDGVFKVQATDSQFNVSGKVGYRKGDNYNYFYVDYVEVVKYTEPEPSLTYTKL